FALATGFRPRLMPRRRVASVTAGGPLHMTNRMAASGRSPLYPSLRLDVTTPVAQLASALDRFQPDLLSGYPSLIAPLAPQPPGPGAAGGQAEDRAALDCLHLRAVAARRARDDPRSLGRALRRLRDHRDRRHAGDRVRGPRGAPPARRHLPGRGRRQGRPPGG